MLAGVVEKRRAWRSAGSRSSLLLLALALAATALARPRAHMNVAEENATVVLLVDVSGSMRATDVKPSRLDAAVDAMRTFLDKLPKKFKVGLVAFSSTAEVLSARRRPTARRSTAASATSRRRPAPRSATGS